MTVADLQPLIFWENGQGNIADVCLFYDIRHDLTSFLSN